jgi:hypothetical protein
MTTDEDRLNHFLAQIEDLNRQIASLQHVLLTEPELYARVPELDRTRRRKRRRSA